ncbi:alpha-galactosidase [Paenibacillus macquariensis]|uniref:Alpha-galactosidase n=1 Tax=Paenibacillus macquariensis TaxID=948756 RepID=A0ABY1KFC3_9BACL|nr:alpha-galactosidase [Paenibacillus macquariensis]MEC0093186.1 alpha-galactosidase [Paenibacillus macquariensis]OAB35066.1 alpha-galactosidase [Paenibacillus macquariensis subsp. macquariensis]SIR62578.1 alpha-galactosidase [Paenibacillus macquariensis]
MTIQYNKQHHVFAIQMKQTSYVFGLNEKGSLQHLYWGASVALEDCLPLLRPWGHSSFDAEVEREMEEYSFWGDLVYTEPSLKVTMHDGVRDLSMKYVSHHIMEQEGQETLVITLQDEVYPLETQLLYKVIPEFDLVVRSAKIVNTGTHDIILENVQSAAWPIPNLQDYRLTHVTGKWSGEFQLRNTVLSEGKKVLESRRGFTDVHANPWFAIDNGHATEDHGNVWFGALAWSGNWKITAEKTSFNQLKVTGGISDFDSEWTLGAGESFEAPEFVGGYTTGGFGNMSRQLHQYQYDYVIPNQEARKVLYNSWEATYFDVNAKDQMALAERAAKLGVELFVVDDGWFGQRNHDRAGLGDWFVNEEKFPNGLNELINKVHDLGMEFGIWVEPESVNPDSDLYRQHPDWVYHFPTRGRTELRNQLLLNISKPEVKSYILEFMTDLLSNHDITFIKWDMNRTITQPGMKDHPLNRQKEIWIRHAQTLYEIWAELRERFPHVAFETCAGGGSRIDLGILRYADQTWPSDNTDAFDRLSIQEGFSYVYAPKMMTCWVTEAVSGMNKRVTSLKYRFHSAMMGTLGIGSNLNEWSDELIEESAGFVEQYKEIRPLVQYGQQYRIDALKKQGVTAVQYVNKQASETVVFAFLHSQRLGDGLPRLRLQGLNPDKTYVIDELSGTWTGKALMNIGVELPLRGDFDSLMYRIQEQE